MGLRYLDVFLIIKGNLYDGYMKVSECLEEHFSSLLCNKYMIPDSFKKTTIKILLNALNQHWKSKNRTYTYFLKGNKGWLEKNIITFLNPLDYFDNDKMLIGKPLQKKKRNGK